MKQLIIRSIFLAVISLATCIGATGQSVAPVVGDLHAFRPLPTGETAISTTVDYLAWGGRTLGILGADVQLGVSSPLSLQLGYRDIAGHGHSAQNRYNADDLCLGSTVRLVKEQSSIPGLDLQVDAVRENGRIRIQDSDSSISADPQVQILGGQMRAKKTIGAQRWKLRAGIYRTEVNGSYLATVGMLGAGLEIPFGRSLGKPSPHWQLAAASYCNNYDEGRRFSYEALAALCIPASSHLSFDVAGVFYPRGVPLAGSVLSPISSVGLVYGSSSTAQIFTTAVGYLSVSGTATF